MSNIPVLGLSPGPEADADPRAWAYSIPALLSDLGADPTGTFSPPPTPGADPASVVGLLVE